MYNVKCPTYTEAYQPISDDNLQRSRDWLNNKKDLVQYIVKNTGFNGSLSDLADAADNVQSMVSCKFLNFVFFVISISLFGYSGFEQS